MQIHTGRGNRQTDTHTHTLSHTYSGCLLYMYSCFPVKMAQLQQVNLLLQAPWIYENPCVYQDTQNRKSLTKLICHHLKQPLHQLLGLKLVFKGEELSTCAAAAFSGVYSRKVYSREASIDEGEMQKKAS